MYECSCQDRMQLSDKSIDYCAAAQNITSAFWYYCFLF